MRQSPTTALVARSLHLSRFGTYATAADGDMELALRPYRWNLDLASAFHSSLGLVEVFLRNAIDSELRSWNREQPKIGGGFHSSDWLLDPARPLNAMTPRMREVEREPPRP